MFGKKKWSLKNPWCASENSIRDCQAALVRQKEYEMGPINTDAAECIAIAYGSWFTGKIQFSRNAFDTFAFCRCKSCCVWKDQANTE